jgi:hypothetical protein
MRLQDLNPFCDLPFEQERLGKAATSADFESAEILVPVVFRDFRVRVDPKAKLVEIGDRDGTIPKTIDQVISNGFREIVPTFDFGDQPPKTILPNWSPSRLATSGSFSSRNLSARSKNSCCFRFSASIPFSISSTNMRAELSFLDLASVRT